MKSLAVVQSLIAQASKTQQQIVAVCMARSVEMMSCGDEAIARGMMQAYLAKHAMRLDSRPPRALCTAGGHAWHSRVWVGCLFST